MDVSGGNVDFSADKIVLSGIRGRKGQQKEYQPFKGEIEIPLGLRTSFFSFCWKVLSAKTEDLPEIKPAEFRGQTVKFRMFANVKAENGYVAGLLVTNEKESMSTKFLFRKYQLLEFLIFFAKLPKITPVADVFLFERTESGQLKVNQVAIPEEIVERIKVAVYTGFHFATLLDGKPFRIGKIISFGELRAPLDEEGRIRLRSVVGI